VTPKRQPLPGILKGSLAWHLAGAAALAAVPSRWPWIVAAMVANHSVIALAGIIPRAQLFGPCQSRLDEYESTANSVALTFDDGPDPEVTPQVLKILKDHNVSATFFPIGRRASNHPELIKEIAEEGHTLENHSWSHSTGFFFHSPRRLAEEIDQSQDLLERLSGRRPVYFRAPAGIRGPLLQPMLIDRKIRLVAWRRRGFDTTDSNPERVLRRLTARLKSRDILLLHDGSSARDSEGHSVVLKALPRLLDALKARGLKPTPLI